MFPVSDAPSPVFESFFAYNATDVGDLNKVLQGYRSGIYRDASVCAMDASQPDHFTCSDVEDASIRNFRILDDACDSIAFVGGEARVEIGEEPVSSGGDIFPGAPYAHTGFCVKDNTTGPEGFEAARDNLFASMERSCDPSPAYNCSYVALKHDMESSRQVEVEGNGVLELSGLSPFTSVLQFTRSGDYSGDGNPASDVFNKYYGSVFSRVCAYAPTDPTEGPEAHCFQVTQGSHSIMNFSSDCSELTVLLGEPLLDAPGDPEYNFEYPLAALMTCTSIAR